MILLSDAAAAVFALWNAFLPAPSGAIPQEPTRTERQAAVRPELQTGLPVQQSDSLRADSLQPVADSIGAARPTMTAARPSGLGYRQPSDTIAPADTIRKPRQKAIVYSDAYATRLTIHRRLSWAMLPLFAASYITGDQLIKDPSGAPTWARNLHGPAATGSALLFGANTITGAWNLWDGRHDPNGRTRKIIHSLLFTVASGGFVYAGTQLANDAEQSQAKRRQHRNVALGSIGVSTVSWLIMLIGN